MKVKAIDYDPEQRKLIVSRDVKFNEEQKNIEISTSENETDRDQYITIESHSEEIPSETDTEDEAPEEQSQQEQPVRRSTRIRSPPQYYGREETNLSVIGEPTTMVEAVRSPDKVNGFRQCKKRKR